MSGSVKIERDDISAQELRQLAGRVKDGRVSRRHLAKALVLEGGLARLQRRVSEWIVRRCAIGFIVTMPRASRGWAIDVAAG